MKRLISLLLSLVLLFGIGAEQQRKALAKARAFFSTVIRPQIRLLLQPYSENKKFPRAKRGGISSLLVDAGGFGPPKRKRNRFTGYFRFSCLFSPKNV